MSKLNNLIDNPIFVGGIRRSGTSLIRSRISSHKKILSGPETFWFELDFKKKLGRKKIKIDEHIFNLVKIYDIKDKKIYNKLVKLDSKKKFLDLFYGYLLSRKKFKKRWLEKTTNNTLHIDYIFKNWKNPLFIYVYRNPKNILASLLKSNNKFTINDLSTEIITHYKFFNKFYRKYKNRILIISYENFVKNYEKMIIKIFKFIGEDVNKLNNNYLKDKSYELIEKTYNHKSHSLLNLKKPIFKDSLRVTISKKDKHLYKKLLVNINNNMHIISKYCDTRLWRF